MSTTSDHKHSTGHASSSDAGVESLARSVLLDIEQANKLFETIGEGVCLATGDGQVVWANAVFSAIDPPTRERILGWCRSASAEVGAGTSGRLLDQPADRTRPDDEPIRGEVVSADERKTYEVSLRPMEPPSAPATPPSKSLADRAFALVTREITAQARLRRDMDAVERAGGDLVRMESDVVRGMNAVERLRHLEGKIVEASQRLLSFDHFVIRLLDTRSGKLEPVIISGLPTSIADFDIYPLAEGNGTSGYVAATGRSYVVRDTSHDELFLPGLGGAKSSLTVPLKLQDKVIGIINVESQQPDAFDDDDRRLAEIFARYIAMALHMLDLLVVERSAVNQSVVDRVEREIRDPLEDIVHEVDLLYDLVPDDRSIREHIDRIRGDVDAIRRRVHDIAQGPNTLLGADVAMTPGPCDPAFQGKRVLVADDQARIRRIIGDILRHRGCEVLVVEDGLKAVIALEEVAAGKRPPFDLVISDIKMPDRNGYEVFASAKKINPELPVILMTGFGYDPHHSIVRASQEGLQAVLFKPFPVERMLEEVKRGLLNPGPATRPAN